MLAMTDPLEVWRTDLKVKSAYTSRPDWDQAVKVWSGLGSVQPESGYESYTPARDTSTERFGVFLPYDAVVASTDRVLYKGNWFEIDKEPMRKSWTSRRHTWVTIWRAVR